MSDPRPIEYSYDFGARLGVSLPELSPLLQSRLQDAINALIDDWREELIEVWPRDTGHSFTMWESFTQGLVVILRNPVEYAGYVHPAGGQDGESWDTLREFWEASALRLVAEFQTAVSEDRRTHKGTLSADLAALVRRSAARRAQDIVAATELAEMVAGDKPARNLSVFRGVRRALMRVSSAERARRPRRDRTRTRVR